MKIVCVFWNPECITEIILKVERLTGKSKTKMEDEESRPWPVTQLVRTSLLYAKVVGLIPGRAHTRNHQ